MTPDAITPAARRGKPKRSLSPPAGPARSGPPGRSRALRALRAPAGPRPRRVSGPIRGGAAAPAGPATSTRRGYSATTIHRAPRRLRPLLLRRPRRGARLPVTGLPLRARLVAGVQGLPDHVVVDRLVRGRAWILVLGVMLAGIVAMQVEVLKLGASMGRSLERGTYLQARNESLRESVAALADDQRIQRLAMQQGMVMPDPTAITFLAPGANAPAARARGAIQPPAAAPGLGSGNSGAAGAPGARGSGSSPP